MIDIFTTYLPVIVSLFFLEVLLSIDNALVNASLAEGLHFEKDRKKAIKIGIIGGAVLRLVALFFATYIIQNKWILILGALYLVYLALDHLFLNREDENHKLKKVYTFWGVVTQIIFADIVFSIDNVISAVGLSHNYKVVVIGLLETVFSLHIGELSKFVMIMGILVTTYVISHRRNKKVK